jgi:hypothetical protein
VLRAPPSPLRGEGTKEGGSHRNVAILTEAYRRWADSKGASADHWISICDQNIRFGSIAEPLKAIAYMGSYRSRDELGQYFAGITRDWEMLDTGWTTSSPRATAW